MMSKTCTDPSTMQSGTAHTSNMSVLNVTCGRHSLSIFTDGSGYFTILSVPSSTTTVTHQLTSVPPIYEYSTPKAHSTRVPASTLRARTSCRRQNRDGFIASPELLQRSTCVGSRKTECKSMRSIHARRPTKPEKTTHARLLSIVRPICTSLPQAASLFLCSPFQCHLQRETTVSPQF